VVRPVRRQKRRRPRVEQGYTAFEMNLVIPPLLFYILGAALVVAGAIRASTLGRRHASRELDDDDPKKATARRRHLAFGVVWILMGVFLLASTAGVLRSRSASSRAAASGPETRGGVPGPVIRLSPVRPTTLQPPATP